MTCAYKFFNISGTINSFSRNTQLTRDLVVGSFQLRCHFCHLRRISFPHNSRQKKVAFHSLAPLLMSSPGPLPPQGQPWSLSGDACPQGVQGDIENDDARFKLWLENCRRYGLDNCDQQLQGIQSGRKTISEVIAEQDSLIASITEEYRRQNAKRTKADQLPDINMPCPQGVQGEDCARFKLWLENCHQFRFGGCTEQLDSFQQGRKTISQVFEEQDRLIREATAAVAYQRKKQENLSGELHDGSKSQADTTEKSGEADLTTSSKLSSGQKLKNAVKVYGSTVVVFHVSISLMSLGLFYTLVSSGIDVVAILSRVGLGDSIIATGTGTFVMAYAVHKIFAPARIAATLTATPLIVRYLRRIGFLKSPPQK